MSSVSGVPVTRILVSGCTANFELLWLLNFLSNQFDFWYAAFFYKFVIQHILSPFKIEPFLSILFLTPLFKNATSRSIYTKLYEVAFKNCSKFVFFQNLII
jgi:hypothetical protein